MMQLEGYIEPVFDATKEQQVFLNVEGKEYIVLHKGAGMDLADLVGNRVSVQAEELDVDSNNPTSLIVVRSYTLLED